MMATRFCSRLDRIISHTDVLPEAVPPQTPIMKGLVLLTLVAILLTSGRELASNLRSVIASNRENATDEKKRCRGRGEKKKRKRKEGIKYSEKAEKRGEEREQQRSVLLGVATSI
jgi:hypothetical protein